MNEKTPAETVIKEINNNNNNNNNNNQDDLQGLQSYSSERCVSFSWRLSHATGARNIFFDIKPL